MSPDPVLYTVSVTSDENYRKSDRHKSTHADPIDNLQVLKKKNPSGSGDVITSKIKDDCWRPYLLMNQNKITGGQKDN